MGFLAVFKVRGSGLTNKTEVDVLEALAFFMNDQSGVCFPSTDAVARIARVHPNVARKTLKELEANGLISTRQAPGCRRYFDLHLDRLPLNETAGGNDLDGVKEVAPLKDVEGVKEVEVAPLTKVEGAPLTSLSTPLKDLEPELTKELTREQRRELTSLDAPERTLWETDHFDNTVKKVEKPKATRAKPKTSCPFSPDDPIPPEYLEYAQAKHPSINAQTEFTKFVNFHLSKDNRYSNWLAAWRTWATKAEEFAKSRPQSQSYTPARRSTDPQAGWVSTQTPTNPPPLYTPEEREALKKKYQAMTAIFAKTDKNV